MITSLSSPSSLLQLLECMVNAAMADNAVANVHPASPLGTSTPQVLAYISGAAILETVHARGLHTSITHVPRKQVRTLRKVATNTHEAEHHCMV
jgi:hypothetical protein